MESPRSTTVFLAIAILALLSSHPFTAAEVRISWTYPGPLTIVTRHPLASDQCYNAPLSNQATEEIRFWNLTGTHRSITRLAGFSGRNCLASATIIDSGPDQHEVIMVGEFRSARIHVELWTPREDGDGSLNENATLIADATAAATVTSSVEVY